MAGIALFFLLVLGLLGWYFVTMHSADKKSRQRQDKMLNSSLAHALGTAKNVRRILGIRNKFGEY